MSGADGSTIDALDEARGLKPVAFDGVVRPPEQQMANDAPAWRRIAEREDLAEADLTRLASAWHTDADLGRPIEVVTDMAKSWRLGFIADQELDAAFFDLFTRLRADRLVPLAAVRPRGSHWTCVPSRAVG